MQNQDYNQIAIQTAEKLHGVRSAYQAEKKAPSPGMENRFPPNNRPGLGIALEYQRMGDQPVSDALNEQCNQLGARFEHLATTIGTVIHDVDLKGDLNDPLIQMIRQTLLERKVIFFRGQNLSEKEQVRFSQCFGELDAFPFGKPGEDPYILQIIHGEEAPGTENSWHTDVTWMENPSLGSVAQCVEVPPIGGDTLFADSHACYLGLPDQLREKITGLEGINDYQIFLTHRAPGGLPESLVDEIKANIPFGVSHPVLRTHPETGKTGLYIHGGFLRQESLHNPQKGEALLAAESKALVDELLKQHHRPEYLCRFKWEPGSIAFWDNRSVQHYATSDYYPHRRVLRRVTIRGDKPYFDAAKDKCYRSNTL